MSNFADGYAGNWLPHKENCRCEECSTERTIASLRARLAEVEAERDSLQRDIEFNSTLYLRDHGGSWGKCKYQSQVETAQADLAAAQERIKVLDTFRFHECSCNNCTRLAALDQEWSDAALLTQEPKP